MSFGNKSLINNISLNITEIDNKTNNPIEEHKIEILNRLDQNLLIGKGKSKNILTGYKINIDL